MLEFIRVATAVPAVQVGDVIRNTEDICRMIAQADAQSCDLVTFPELAMTGYTCADLFFQNSLLLQCMKGLEKIIACSAQYPRVTAVVGTPAVLDGQMYNCGAVISQGKLWGLVPKTYLPNYSEFSERRWFSSAMDLQVGEVGAKELGLAGDDVIPVGRDLIFRLGDGCMLGVEICEDLWTPLPPSTLLSINGAEVIVNLSASNEVAGKRAVRNALVAHQSDICNCIYAYCSSGFTESTQDIVFSGHSILSECGSKLGENEKRMDSDYLLVRDADIGKVRSARRKNKSVRDAASFYGKVEPMRTVDCRGESLRGDGSLYPVERMPYLPTGGADAVEDCMSVFDIQVAGLMRRLALRDADAVVGVTGGMDSTLALLVAVEAMRRLGRGVREVHALLLPCGTQAHRSGEKARALLDALGVRYQCIDIEQHVALHLHDLKTPASEGDELYENVLARERTQILMNYAGAHDAIVVGTGDLSELALGWCTYNGDQMSMYGVNASVPKTLVAWMVARLAESALFAPQREALSALLRQRAEQPADSGLPAPREQVGPYELHDFFLYYMARYAYSPTKIFALACRAFAPDYDAATIKKWMRVFYQRFFAEQYKRNCMPEGVKIGAISLSPRADWRMPSDASVRLWLDEVQSLCTEEKTPSCTLHANGV